jgi:transposase-like protein
MSQHYLLSAAARSLSLAKVMRMSDDQAWEAFKTIRWADNGGEPNCPKCGSVGTYTFKARRIFKCKDCGSQFSVTSGTIFASRKMAIRDILGAIAIFVNGAKGHSALQLSRDLDCQYKTAFVLAHKIREAIGSQQDHASLSGEVEIDGAYFGGTVRPYNVKSERPDRRLRMNRSDKRRVVITMRERGGRTAAFVAKSEAASTSVIMEKVALGSTVYADEAAGWDILHARYLTRRINHSVAYSTPEANTNQAESFFSRLRRSEIGIHHHFSRYLGAYAAEMAWREDRRRVSNGEQFLAATSAALGHPVSRQWKGYWQR